MYKYILVLLMVISPFASTSTLKYEIDMELSRDGKLVSKPKVVVNIGETASIIQADEYGRHEMTVVSEESTFNGESMIHLKLKIESFTKDGQRQLLSSPEIITHENETAEITVGDAESDKDLLLKVIAKRRL